MALVTRSPGARGRDSSSGWVAFHAVSRNQYEPAKIAEILLVAGADPNDLDDDGSTPSALLRMILERNAKRNGARVGPAFERLQSLFEVLEPVTTQKGPAEAVD